jgi:hypothetical protein
VKFVSEGELIPKYYGVSYRRYDISMTVCHVVPFNWIVKWWRTLWIYLKQNGRDVTFWEKRDAAFVQNIRAIEECRAMERIQGIAERRAEQIYQERFNRDFDERIDAAIKLSRQTRRLDG